MIATGGSRIHDGPGGLRGHVYRDQTVARRDPPMRRSVTAAGVAVTQIARPFVRLPGDRRKNGETPAFLSDGGDITARFNPLAPGSCWNRVHPIPCGWHLLPERVIFYTHYRGDRPGRECGVSYRFTVQARQPRWWFCVSGDPPGTGSRCFASCLGFGRRDWRSSVHIKIAQAHGAAD